MRVGPCMILIAPLAAVSLVSAVSFGHSLEAAGGFLSNFDGEHRSRFGSDAAWSLGYSTPLSPEQGPADVHLMIEASYLTASDDGLSDPTFGGAREKYRFIPLLIGVRTNFVQNKDHPGVSLFGGLAVATMLGEFTDLNGKTDSATSFGGAVELRPQFRISGPWSLWVRQRVYIFGDVRYRGFGEVNHSGACMQAGLSVRLDKDASR